MEPIVILIFPIRTVWWSLKTSQTAGCESKYQALTTPMRHSNKHYYTKNRLTLVHFTILLVMPITMRVEQHYHYSSETWHYFIMWHFLLAHLGWSPKKCERKRIKSACFSLFPCFSVTMAKFIRSPKPMEDRTMLPLCLDIKPTMEPQMFYARYGEFNY